MDYSKKTKDSYTSTMGVFSKKAPGRANVYCSTYIYVYKKAPKRFQTVGTLFKYIYIYTYRATI